MAAPLTVDAAERYDITLLAFFGTRGAAALGR
jgi:hypothetical protein